MLSVLLELRLRVDGWFDLLQACQQSQVVKIYLFKFRLTNGIPRSPRSQSSAWYVGVSRQDEAQLLEEDRVLLHDLRVALRLDPRALRVVRADVARLAVVDHRLDVADVLPVHLLQPVPRDRLAQPVGGPHGPRLGRHGSPSVTLPTAAALLTYGLYFLKTLLSTLYVVH